MPFVIDSVLPGGAASFADMQKGDSIVGVNGKVGLCQVQIANELAKYPCDSVTLDFYRNGYTAPIVDLQLQYIAPLTINDVAVIETRYIDSVAAKLCFEYVIRRQSDGALVARGSSVQVFVDSDGNMALNNPAFFTEWKTKWLAKE